MVTQEISHTSVVSSAFGFLDYKPADVLEKDCAWATRGVTACTADYLFSSLRTSVVAAGRPAEPNSSPSVFSLDDPICYRILVELRCPHAPSRS